ncbi:hypothetical protein Q7C_2556 [Methylophaga frappieri]|uniref:Uncharacterized protein n=1 Tax=Methylophaga frappieri (strain ATCC BAA-2434 / DSM 25690 / JAM7) TaxID=754477 RepID=I1YL84_METFJ|nr:hypothetical protein Q7C_2556 [Methylophaga frappieri]
MAVLIFLAWQAWPSLIGIKSAVSVYFSQRAIELPLRLAFRAQDNFICRN